MCGGEEQELAVRLSAEAGVELRVGWVGWRGRGGEGSDKTRAERERHVLRCRGGVSFRSSRNRGDIAGGQGVWECRGGRSGSACGRDARERRGLVRETEKTLSGICDDS